MTAPLTMATEQFKALLGPLASAWPIRWQNGQWPSGTILSDGNMPVDANGAPAPAVEAEIIGRREDAISLGDGDDGLRSQVMMGSVRAYVSVGQGTGDAAITGACDSIASGLRRRAIQIDASTRLVTLDPRIDDNTAAYEQGDRFVRTVTVPFDLYFRG